MLVLIALLFSQLSFAQLSETPLKSTEVKKSPTKVKASATTPPAKSVKEVPAPKVDANPPANSAPRTSGSRPMHIEYGSSSWNTDSRKIDSAFMVMKDKNSGKMVQIQLEETEPDSSQFDGQFHVNLSERGLDPEVYVPPKELRNPERDYKKVHEMIQSNKLQSKPLIMKENEKGQPVVDVYDTTEQADAAQKAWDEQKRLMSEAKQQKLIKPVPDKEKVAAAAEAEHKAQMNKLAIQAAAQEADRVRLEQIERQRALDRERAAKAMSAAERAQRKAKAAKLAEEAMTHFGKGEFDQAENLFRHAQDLDPENKTFAFRYGVTLYRLNKFNEAVVVLKLAQVEPSGEIERQYFLGLTHYRLKEYASAKEAFKKAAGSTDPTMGPASNFYLGLVQYSQEEYQDAKKSFETVLDTSQDPKMDNQAEEYIELILQQLQFKKLQEKPWTVTGTVGANYDSNVTYSPDPTAGSSATKIDDIRLNTVADLVYRGIYNRTHELSAKANANLTNSRRDSASASDAWVYNFSVPYSYKATAFGKGYILAIRPAYEDTWMEDSGTDSKTKKSVINSMALDIDNTFVMKPNHFATYSFGYRQDDYTLTSSTGDDNFDANKFNIKTTHIFYLDDSKKEAFVATLGLTLNDAVGKNKTYNRIDIGASFTRPMKWGYSWNLGIAAFQVDYSKATTERKDLNFAVSSGISKPIREWVTWSVTGTFTKNDSTQEDTYEYDKYVISTQAVFNTIF